MKIINKSRAKHDMLFCGHLAINKDGINGQTIKTRIMLDAALKLGFNVKYFDTSKINQSKLNSILFLFKEVRSVKNIILLPAQNGIKFLFPFLFILARLFNRKIILIQIGGWLEQFYNKYFLLKLMLKKTDCIATELKSLELKYKSDGIRNAIYLPNFRFFDGTKVPNRKVINSKTRFVFFARMTELKGINFVIDAINLIKDKQIINHFSIDFYGPFVSFSQEKLFADKIKKHDNIYYKGVLINNKITTLSKYDVLIFPTLHKTEGVPGTIIDAFFSGLPVLASDINATRELISVNNTGWLFNYNDMDDFIRKLTSIINNSSKLKKMKMNCFEEGEKFTFTYNQELIRKILK